MDPPSRPLHKRSGPAESGRGVPPAARALLVAIIVVLVILVAAVAPRVRDYELFLSGFWAAGPAFLKEAGLSAMYLYVAPREQGRRQGYLVMADADGVVVCNQGVEIEYGGAAGRWRSALMSHFTAGAQETYRVPAARFAYDDEAVMPEVMRLGLNATEGTLALYTDEKIYAFLYKDNETSVAANEEYRSDGEMPSGL